MSTTLFDIILQNIILSTLLTYHDVHHTINSIEYANVYAKNYQLQEKHVLLGLKKPFIKTTLVKLRRFLLVSYIYPLHIYTKS